MPSAITKYKIFLASPGDLIDDRISVSEVIDELNTTFGQPNDIHLELIRWETHSAPAISNQHIQKIINKDVGDNYDLFIGLLWKRFGTPTDEADSGTEEEFLNAFKRFKQDPKSIQILFYFNKTPFSIDDIDPDQLKKIKDFRKDLGENKGVFYWEYNDTLQLSKFLRIHIQQRITDLQENIKEVQETAQVEKAVEEVLIPEIVKEEYGLIDYQDMFDEHMRESNQAMVKMSDSMNWVTDQFSKKTNEIHALTLGGNQPGRKIVRDLYNRTAKIMDNFGSRIATETPIFFDNFEKATDAIQNILDIYRNDLEVDQEEVKETLEAVSHLAIIIADSITSMDDFIQSIIDFPRMSKELNKAKSDLVTKLDKLLNNFEISHSIIIELQKSLEDLT